MISPFFTTATESPTTSSFFMISPKSASAFSFCANPDNETKSRNKMDEIFGESNLIIILFFINL